MFEKRKNRSFPCGQEAGIKGAGCCSGRLEDFAEEFEAERLEMGYGSGVLRHVSCCPHAFISSGISGKESLLSDPCDEILLCQQGHS